MKKFLVLVVLLGFVFINIKTVQANSVDNVSSIVNSSDFGFSNAFLAADDDDDDDDTDWDDEDLNSFFKNKDKTDKDKKKKDKKKKTKKK